MNLSRISNEGEPNSEYDFNRPLLSAGHEIFGTLPLLMSAGLGYNPLLPASILSLASALKVPVSALINSLSNQAELQRTLSEKHQQHHDEDEDDINGDENGEQPPIKKQKIIIQGVPKHIALDPQTLREYIIN